MRLVLDSVYEYPKKIIEFTELEISEEIYNNNGDIHTIDMRDEHAEDDIYYSIDSTRFDYFPDELRARFRIKETGQNRFMSCYMTVGRSKEKFRQVIEEFNKVVLKIAETGYCKQSDFDFTDCEWE